MRRISSALAFVALFFVSGHAVGLSLNLRGPTFKAGHPKQGEALQDAVSDGEMEALAESADILKRYPNILFEITGHTDAGECASDDCQELALRRAVLVYRYLLDAGIDPRQVVTLREYSSSRSIVIDDENREINRRAEINVMLEP